MARRRFVAARRQGPRRLTEWGGSADIDNSAIVAAGTAVLTQDFTQAVLAAVVPATIVRVRGEIWVASDQASASEEPFGALGFAVVKEQARVAGVASVPSPITDETDDSWFVLQFIQAFFATGQGVTWQRYAFDSRAMRKLADGDALVMVVENAAQLHGLEFILKFRVLFKLH